jgi:hypothetical protein
MAAEGFFKGLSLDVWYKAFIYVGGVALLLSLFYPVRGITNSQLQLIASGLFLFGIGEWKNHKHTDGIKPANVYSGPAALITRTSWRPDLFGLVFDLVGVVLIILGIISVVKGPTLTFDTATNEHGSTNKPINSQMQDSYFKNAIEDESTSPYFIVITVVNDSTGNAQTLCTTANFFLGAIHIEYAIPYDSSGERVAELIVLSNHSRIYHFAKRASLDNIPITYDSTILNQAREKLSTMTDPRHGRAFDSKPVVFKPPEGLEKYPDAVAHVLVESGFRVRRADVTGQLLLND